jgi:hypothetical protein
LTPCLPALTTTPQEIPCTRKNSCNQLPKSY